MSILGGDYSAARPTVATLKSLGIQFVCRYGGDGGSKDLTLAEAQYLSNGGIWIVANFESAGRGGSFAQGQADARAADAHFRQCGAVGNFIIYFSIDYDETNPAAQDQYFKGINSIIGKSRTDAYGERAIILHLRSAGLIRGGQCGWRTMSTGWTGGAGSTSEFAVEQVYPPFNNSIDKNIAYVSLAQLGAWKVGISPTPTPAPSPTPVPVPVPPVIHSNLLENAMHFDLVTPGKYFAFTNPAAVLGGTAHLTVAVDFADVVVRVAVFDINGHPTVTNYTVAVAKSALNIALPPAANKVSIGLVSGTGIAGADIYL